MKIDPYYQRQKCSPGILVSSKISFMRIFARVRWRGGVKWEWGGRKWRFSLSFAHYIFRKCHNYYTIILTYGWPKIRNCLSPINTQIMMNVQTRKKNVPDCKKHNYC